LLAVVPAAVAAAVSSLLHLHLMAPVQLVELVGLMGPTVCVELMRLSGILAELVLMWSVCV
jgi:hypothetical protein